MKEKEDVKKDWNDFIKKLQILAYDLIDWKWTAIRLFFNGIFAYAVGFFVSELWELALYKYAIQGQMSTEIGGILSWTAALIYLIFKMPLSYKSNYMESKAFYNQKLLEDEKNGSQ